MTSFAGGGLSLVTALKLDIFSFSFSVTCKVRVSLFFSFSFFFYCMKKFLEALGNHNIENGSAMKTNLGNQCFKEELRKFWMFGLSDF